MVAEPTDIVSDLSREDLFAPERIRRTIESVTVPLFGALRKVYYKTPVSLEERAAARRAITIDEQGELHQHIERWVDVIILRLCNADGSPLLFKTDRKRLLSTSADEIEAIIKALGAGSMDELNLEEATAEGKKN